MCKWIVAQIHMDTKRVIIIEEINNRPRAIQETKNIDTIDVISVDSLNRLVLNGYKVVK